MTPDGGDSPSDRPDHIIPFLLERPELRGRLFRAETSVDQVLSRHDYPSPVAHLLGELLVLGGLLSSLLKFDGVFTLQIRGQGPVRLMVVDITSAGALRGTAEFDAEAVDRLRQAAGTAPVSAAALLNPGQLVFTVELGGDRPSHQGIVELDGETLGECVQHYFRQSEQLKTATSIAVRHQHDGWRAAGLLLQQLPENLDPAGAPAGEDEEDSWRRAVVLMATGTDQELLDPTLPANDLLYRLFHEEQVRVFTPRAIAFGCRCSRERIETTLRGLPRDDIEALRDEGEAVVTCQFCNSVYRFDEAALDAVMA